MAFAAGSCDVNSEVCKVTRIHLIPLIIRFAYFSKESCENNANTLKNDYHSLH